MRAIFFGTPQLAVPSLEAVHDVAEIVQVICQPDRPAGRGMKLRPPPVKERALALGLEVTQPKKVRTAEFAASLRALEADVAVVIAYGRILPQAVLDAPRRGCVNVHASLLPKLRGAGPINRAIVEGHAETGVCLMQMDAGMDTGPVITCAATPIGVDENAAELGTRLADMGAELLRAHLAEWVDGEVLKVHRTRLHDASGQLGAPGQVLSGNGLAGDGLVVACGQGAVAVERLQLQGKKKLDARDFLAGRPIAPGALLGEKTT